jgi:hypothetical protein
MVDIVTTNRNYPKPHLSNTPPTDIPKLQAALDAIDADMQQALLAALSAAPQSALAGLIAASEKGAINGVAPLDTAGRVSEQYLPASVIGAPQFIDVWTPATNTPTIAAAATGNRGNYYLVGTAGTSTAPIAQAWGVGDYIISTGTAWKRIPAITGVSSVAGRTGAVTLSTADISNSSASSRAVMAAADYAAIRTLLSLGSAALLAAGTATGNVPVLAAPNKLGALDGGNLTNLPNLEASAQAHGVMTQVLNLSYTRSGTTVTVIHSAHGMATGHWCKVVVTSGTATTGLYQITVVDVNTWTFTDSVSGATSGTLSRDAWLKRQLNISNVNRQLAGRHAWFFQTPMPGPHPVITGNCLTPSGPFGAVFGTDVVTIRNVNRFVSTTGIPGSPSEDASIIDFIVFA